MHRECSRRHAEAAWREVAAAGVQPHASGGAAAQAPALCSVCMLAAMPAAAALRGWAAGWAAAAVRCGCGGAAAEPMLEGGCDFFLCPSHSPCRPHRSRLSPLLPLSQGIFKVLGKGELPAQPLLVKAKFFSKDAEKKIKAVGGACQLVA